MDGLKILIAEGANVDYENRRDTPRSPPRVANQRDAALYVLAHGADPDRQPQWTHGVVHDGESPEDPDMIVTLLESGARGAIETSKGVTALIAAAEAGKCGPAVALCRAGMSPEHVNHHGETALMAAARCGRGEVIGALIDAGAQKDFETADGDTALLAAVKAGQVGAMNQILRRGADANYENAKGGTALILAIDLGRFTPSSSGGSRREIGLRESPRSHALTMAAASAKVDVITALLVNKATPDHETRDGRTALIHAAMMGQDDAITSLVARGARIDLETSQGRTALIMAAISADVDAIRTPVAAGADPNYENNRKDTAWIGRRRWASRVYPRTPATPARRLTSSPRRG